MLSLFRIPQPLRRKGLLCFRTGSSQCMTLLILCLLGIIVFTSKADLDTPKRMSSAFLRSLILIHDLTAFEDIIQSLGVNVDPLSYEPALSLQTLTMRYSSKRGRAPPPGFNQWYQYAKKEQCFLDRYDQIYRDLAPFWNMSQSEFKQRLMMLKDGPNLQEVSIVNGIMSINGPSVQSSTLKPVSLHLLVIPLTSRVDWSACLDCQFPSKYDILR